MITKQTNEFDSSMIKGSNYNAATKEMTVTFRNGAAYIYEEVEMEDYMEFTRAASQGKALNELIKPKYENYKKVDA